MTDSRKGLTKYFSAAAAAALLYLSIGCATVLPAVSRHDLTVELHPESHSALVMDQIAINDWKAGELVFSIAEKAEIRSVSIDGASAKYSFREGLLTVAPDTPGSGGDLTVNVSYSAVFDDPIESAPANFDNPGFGVEATISDKGVFLLPGSGWYPRIEGTSSFAIKVIAPRGVYAVTAGELVGIADDGDRSVSTWKVEALGQGIALSAARYSIRSEKAGEVPVFTWFFPESEPLSDTYLKAASSHIAFYDSLHGPYAFSKFAVVENFFPTGYGFPSYTLLGSQVLRLPFIPGTSLRHEIAHCWWGNGVLVDHGSGNWSEGLTTYVADYLSREIVSAKDGEDYRRQALREFASLAASHGDFPLEEFAERTDPATKAVGYGKAAFVFHMVRKKMGDDPFWRSLRRIYSERFQMRTSWEDFRKVFVAEGGWEERESRRFFDQWLTRAGAPVLRLENVSVKKSAAGWKTSGAVVQDSPFYDMDLKLALWTPAAGRIDSMVKISGTSSRFAVESAGRPQKLALDPDADAFRLLYPEEVPATVNSLKSSKDLVAVLAGGISPDAAGEVEILLAGLNNASAPILRENEVDPKDIRGKDVLFFGFPQSEKFRDRFSSAPPRLKISPERFSLDDYFSSDNADSLFVVFSGLVGKNLTALFLPVTGTGSDSIARTARKITHYGQYSYLTFDAGTNRAKGAWEVSRSPLVFQFEQP